MVRRSRTTQTTAPPGRARMRAGRMRPIAALAGIAAVALAACAVLLAAGCGGHSLGLTGGSIPIGLSTLQGRVVRADDPTRAVPGAVANLSYDTTHSGTQAADSAGAFTFSNIAGGHYTCAVVPKVGSDLATDWDWAFDIPASTRVQLVAAIWPAGADVSGVAAVTITPAPATLHVGDTVRFSAAALDANARPIAGLRPSLILVGDLGDLAPDGTLTATRAGTGKLGAWVHGVEQYTDITVTP